MKITIERTYLAAALGVVCRAVSARNTLPILSHVLLQTEDDRLKLSATDLDTAITCALPASVVENGSVAVPASSLNDYVSKLPDAPITLELKAHQLLIRCGHSKFTLNTSPAKDFPDVPGVAPGVGTEIQLPAATLKEMLRLTAFAASKEESRSLMMGVLFEARGNALTLVATDTHRLAWSQEQLASEARVPVTAVVPAKPLVELERVLKNSAEEIVTVRFGSAQVQFESSNATLISRVLDGQFPNYERVIPKQTERRVIFERGDLLKAVRRVEIVSSTASNKMLVKFGGTTMNLTAESAEAGRAEEELPITMDGSDLEICFNAKYLSEVLSTLSDDQLSLELNGALNPGILRAGDNFLYIVMPMQA